MIRITTACVFLVASTILAAPVANPMVERSKLEKLAEAAKTPKEHVTVAKQYRLQSERFEEKALKHETEARKLEAAPRTPMAHKWPAMAGQPWVKERQLAVEARRAAKECTQIAELHLELSVEKLAAAGAANPARRNDLD